MSWVNVGNIKGDTGATGPEGGNVRIYKDSAHQVIIFVGEEDEVDLYFSEIKGPKGDTGPAGPVNIASSLDTTDNTNAIKNAPVAIAIENISNQIGTITAVQQSNLTLLGS